MNDADIAGYLGQRTVIAGAVNCGKTTRTAALLKQFLVAGHTHDLAIVDLAPDPVRGIGGKLALELPPQVLYLTAPIAAPRLMGRNAAHVMELAIRNAKVIETLFAELERQPRDILFLNDVTLYLQAGNLDRLLGLLRNSGTVIINAYYGNSFADSELTRRERQLTKTLMDHCDNVILL